MRAALRIVGPEVEPSEEDAVAAPADLDAPVDVADLRREVEARIVAGRGPVIVDCTRVRSIGTPTLGWLTDVATLLRRHGRTLQLRNCDDRLRFRLRDVPAELTRGE